jgi:hypothetical protein
VDEQDLPLQQAAENSKWALTDWPEKTITSFSGWGQDDAMSMSVWDKRGWLQGIQPAQESQNTAPPAHQQQQQLMNNFPSHDLHWRIKWVVLF